VLAYYQWHTARSFAYLYKRGLTFTRILSLYPTLHEADLSKFVSVADGIVDKSKSSGESNLKQIRRAKGITQRELAEQSGVSLRIIQQYEQKQRDIQKAEAQSIVAMANVLGCSVEELFE